MSAEDTQNRDQDASPGAAPARLMIRIPDKLEPEFRQREKDRFTIYIRLSCIFAMAVFPMFFVWDWIVAPDQVWDLFRFRVLAVILIGVVLATSYSRAGQNYIYSLGTGVILIVFALTLYIQVSIETNSGLELGYGILMLPYFLVALAFPTIPALITTFLTFIPLGLALTSKQHSFDFIFNYVSIFLSGGIFVVLLSFISTQMRRSSFMLEKDLENAKNEADQANEAKSSFLATMSHEIRTPLNGILGIVNLMKDTPLEVEQQNHLKTIQYSGETLLTMLNDVLDLSKIEAGQLSLEYIDFDLSRLVSSVTDLMRSRADEKGLKLEISINSDVPAFINSDPTRLRQVLLNLVSNAIKFTTRGSVTFYVDPEATETRNGELFSTLVFEVEDTGIGIPPEKTDILFDDFTQSDSSISRQYGGTGLGLSICRKIIRLMNGDIGVASIEGAGSTFWFELDAKVVNQDSTLVFYDEANKEIPRLEPLKILVVDDNMVNQKVARGLLEKYGHEVETADGGQETLDKVLEGKTIYDLVLMDMQMPGMDGLETTRRIRAHDSGYTRDLPIIALTANTLEGDYERCTAAGMDGHIGKPINPYELFHKIQKHTGAKNTTDDHATSRSKQSPQTSRHKTRTVIREIEEAARLDLTKLQEMESLMGEEYIKGFIEENIIYVEEFVAKVLESSKGRDADTLQYAAHELKTLSSIFGFTSLSLLAEAIESSCTQNRVEEAAILANSLSERYADNLAALGKVYPAAIAEQKNMH